MKIPEPVIPKEHGGWAVLFVPVLIGAGVAGGFTVRCVWLALAELGVFLSYEPDLTILKHRFFTAQPEGRLKQAVVWASVYLTAAIACSVPLLLQGYVLLVLAGVGGVSALLLSFILQRRYTGAVPGDLVAVLGLSLGAPCAYYVTTGFLDSRALMLWVFNCLFFGSGVLYVHMKIRVAARKEELKFMDRLSVGRLNLIYHAFVILVVVAFVLSHQTGLVAAMAFVPMTVHAVYGTFRRTGRVKFRNLGFLLTGQSIVFAVVLWGALR